MGVVIDTPFLRYRIRVECYTIYRKIGVDSQTTDLWVGGVALQHHAFGGFPMKERILERELKDKQDFEEVIAQLRVAFTWAKLEHKQFFLEVWMADRTTALPRNSEGIKKKQYLTAITSELLPVEIP